MRQIIEQYNHWTRTSNTFEAVADFNKATANPHVHLSDAGYKAMADPIDLSIFK